MPRQPNLEKRKAKTLEAARRSYRKAMYPHWIAYQQAIDLIEAEYKKDTCQ